MDVFPEVLHSPGWVVAADVLRLLVLVVSACLVGLTARTLAQLRRRPDAGTARLRLWALLLAALSVGGSEWDRVGQPVTLRLPLNLAFLVTVLLVLSSNHGRAPRRGDGRPRPVHDPRERSHE